MSDWAFVEHVTQQLLRPRPGDSKHPTLWPSEASCTFQNEHEETVVAGKCRRSRFFRYLTYSYEFYPKYKVWRPLVERLKTEAKAVDKYMLWIWAAGELYEEYLIRQSKCSGIFVSEQVPVYVKSHNVSGKKDIVVVNPKTNKLSIVEAKSVYGFGANTVLGTPSQRAKGVMGVPRESNLMQIAIYHWWSASMDDAYEESRLVYGARDTGRYAEYLVRTVEEEGTIWVEYKPHHPYMGQWVRTKMTINSILDEFSNTQRAVDGGRIPERDFDQKFSEEKLAVMYERDEFAKGDKEKYEKIQARKAENAWILHMQTFEDEEELIEEAVRIRDILLAPVNKLLDAYFAYEEKPEEKKALAKYDKTRTKLIAALRAVALKKELTPLEKGNWQCSYCKYAPICYDKEGNPQDIE
jgi:hypothetical protein